VTQSGEFAQPAAHQDVGRMFVIVDDHAGSRGSALTEADRARKADTARMNDDSWAKISGGAITSDLLASAGLV
jgi:hypothetical protein